MSRAGISPLAMNPVQPDCLAPAAPQIGRMADLTIPHRPRTAGQILDMPNRRCSVMSDTARSHRRSIFLEIGLLEHNSEHNSETAAQDHAAGDVSPTASVVPEEYLAEDFSPSSPSSPPRPTSSATTLDTASSVSLPKVSRAKRQSWSPGQFSDVFASPRSRTQQPRLSPVSATSTSSASSTWSAWSGATAVSAASTASAATATATTTTTTATIVTTVTAAYPTKRKRSWYDKLGDATWRKIRNEPTPTKSANPRRGGPRRVNTDSIFVVRPGHMPDDAKNSITVRRANTVTIAEYEEVTKASAQRQTTQRRRLQRRSHQQLHQQYAFPYK